MAQKLGAVVVGTVVKINENGSPVNYLVVHQGLPSSMYDASCDGTWVLRRDIYKNAVWDAENSNVLPGADIFTTMSGMLSLYDSFIQSAIKTVKIPYCIGGNSPTVKNGADGLQCKIFPLSGYEVGFTKSTNGFFPEDGSVLSYFKGMSDVDPKRTAKIENVNGRWLLRSSTFANYGGVWAVETTGGSRVVDSSASNGIRNAFILPDDLYVEDDGTVFRPNPPSFITATPSVMRGQPINVSWSSVDRANSYILQRKAGSGDWEQVYTGSDTKYTDTAGSWSTVQYRACGVFDGNCGPFATSKTVSVIPASALVISGSDGDLGTITNDIPYSVNTDTGNNVTLVLTVNGAKVVSGTVQNGFSDKIPVLDLPTGTNTIVITATVTASSGQVTVTRTWTYTKAAVSFPASGGVALLTKNGQNVFPMTLAEAVKTIGGPWGKNLSEALDKMVPFMVSGAKIATGRYKGTGAYGSGNPNTLTFPFEPKVVFLLNQKNSSGIYTSFFATYLNSTPCVNMEAVTTEYGTDIGFGNGEAGNRYGKKSADGKTLYWYTTDSVKQANTAGNTYYWLAIG